MKSRLRCFIEKELLVWMFYCCFLLCSRLLRTCLGFEKHVGLAASSDRLKSSGSLATQTRARAHMATGKTRVVDPLRETGAQISRVQQMSGNLVKLEALRPIEKIEWTTSF